MAFPLINPIFQFFDNAGEPLSGGFLQVYAPASVTPKNTWQNENLSILNDNPIQLDSAGRCTIFLTDGEEYKFVLMNSALAVIKTVDEVKSPSSISQAAIGAALYPRSATEISAGVTPTDYTRPYGDFVRYGLATGASGTTNATAVNNGLLSNSYCFCHDPGTYSISNTMNAQSDQTVFLAQGVVLQATSKNWSGLGFLRLQLVDNFQLTGGVFDGNKAVQPAGNLLGITMLGASNVRLVGVTAMNFPSDNVTLGSQGDGFYIGNSGSTICTNIELHGCYSLNNVRQGLSIVQADGVAVIGGAYNGTTGNNPGAGIDVEADPGVGDVRNIRIANVELRGNYSSLVLTESSFNVTVTGCQMLESRKTTLILSDPTNATIIGNYIEGSGQTVDSPIVDVVNATNLLFSGNVIQGEGSASAHEGAGIRFAVGSTNVSITGNTIMNTRTQGISLGSSALSGDPTLINISNNMFIDCLDGAAFANNSVIGIGGNTVGGHYPLLVTVKNNIIRDTRGTPTRYGVLLANIPAATSANYRIEGNFIQGLPDPFTDNVSTVPPLCGIVTWNPGNLVDGAGETSPDITVTGAAIGDTVLVFPPYVITDCICTGYVKSSNTVVIRLQNESGAAAFDGASASWRVKVIKLLQA